DYYCQVYDTSYIF
nr:immunoglobulin light chain junction region [Macaca mulatta]MOX81240.1 immunoglobulin light chain junction region [Macaca mulatta]MOX83440.1 immunoglobulin light chain junction region [Macaca mulatta]